VKIPPRNRSDSWASSPAAELLIIAKPAESSVSVTVISNGLVVTPPLTRVRSPERQASIMTTWRSAPVALIWSRNAWNPSRVRRR
jgi:hypothetical protein